MIGSDMKQLKQTQESRLCHQLINRRSWNLLHGDSGCSITLEYTEIVLDYSGDLDMFGYDEEYKSYGAMDDDQITYNVTVTPDLDMNAHPTVNSSYLEARLGPRRQGLTMVIPITIIYCIIFLFGIIGNISTCIVIARNRFMQTATNIYLFNLAISDLLMLILGLPQETYIYWSAYPYVLGEMFCLIRTMAAETSTNASILTITAFTVERYVAICHPMRSQTMSSLKRVIKVIVCIWIVSGICSIPMVVQFGIVYLEDDSGRNIPESATCGIRPSHYLQYAFEMSTFLFFVTPMTIITALYALIAIAIRRSTLTRTGSDSSHRSDNTGSELRAQQQAKARRSVLKMLVAVVVAFFLCWAPFHAQRLMVIYMSRDQWTQKFQEFQEVFYRTSGVFYYVISVVNPVLYNVMSLKFRQAFKSTIFWSCKGSGRQKSKSTVLRTYRFRNGHYAMDAKVDANGYASLIEAKKTNLEMQCIGAKTRSYSSSQSGVNYPLGHLMGMSNASDTESSHQLEENKACHSCQYQTRLSPSASTEQRRYHSYA